MELTFFVLEHIGDVMSLKSNIPMYILISIDFLSILGSFIECIDRFVKTFWFKFTEDDTVDDFHYQL